MTLKHVALLKNYTIEKANIPSLPELQEMAQFEGAQLIGYKMTSDMIQIKED
jgi:peroxiredoxin family protein